MLTIDLVRLSEGINPLKLLFSGDTPLFRGLDIELAGRGTVEGSIRKRSDDLFLLSLSMEVSIRLQCRRCLEMFIEDVRAEISRVAMRKEGREREQPTGEHVEDILYLAPRQRELDLGEAVREQFILNLPVYPLCRKECKGLCAGCGVDLNKEPCHCTG